MIRFSENEFEIALCTYNRVDFVKYWLEKCFNEIKKRNINLSIYDSSTNDDTECFIKNEFNNSIEYHRVDRDTTIGYKPMIPILNTTSKYIWISGDSRYHSFDELDETVFKSIKNEIDYILISAGYHNEYANKVLTDKNEIIKKLFVSMTCIGLSIYRSSIFDRLKSNNELLNICDKKFKHNYGFAWIGYFLEVFKEKPYTLAYYCIKINSILPKIKKQVWSSKFYECWVENLCDLADNISTVYTIKEKIPSIVWEEMNLSGFRYCYKARVFGDLNISSYLKYTKNKMLYKCTKNVFRIKLYACLPFFLVKVIYFLDRVFVKIKNLRRIKFLNILLMI